MTAFLAAVAAQPFDQIADSDADVHEQVVVSIEAERVRREVARLPKLEREVIRLRYGLDCQPLSHRQIARRLGLSASIHRGGWGCRPVVSEE